MYTDPAEQKGPRLPTKELIFLGALLLLFLLGAGWVSVHHSEKAARLRLLTTAQEAMSKSDYASAVSTCEKAAKRYPDDSELQRLLSDATSKLEAQRAKEAEERKRQEEAIAAKKRAAQAAAKAKKAKAEAALSGFRREVDDMRGITWYYSKSSSRYDDRKEVLLYMGRETSEATPSLRLRMRYTADDWLFVRSYLFKVDGSSYTITPGLLDVERDHSGGRIWEWFDCKVADKESRRAFAQIDPAMVPADLTEMVVLSEDANRLLRALINCKTAKMRYIGDQYYADRTLTKTELDAIRKVYEVYLGLDGSL